MQKQAKIKYSDPQVKKIVWNLKHFNKEYKTAYNTFLSTLLCGIFLPLSGLMLMLIIHDIEARFLIPLCCVGIACLSAFFAGCSAQKLLKESGYNGTYDPILSEFAKLRTRAFLIAAITLLGIVLWGIYGATIYEDFEQTLRLLKIMREDEVLEILSPLMWLSMIGCLLCYVLQCFLARPTGRIKNQLVLEAIASESENAPSEQIEETEQPQAETEQPQPQAGNPHAEAPQSAQSNFCTVCGNRITDPEALFCERCGRRLK